MSEQSRVHLAEPHTVVCPNCGASSLMQPVEYQLSIFRTGNVGWWCRQCDRDVAVDGDGAMVGRPTRHKRTPKR